MYLLSISRQFMQIFFSVDACISSLTVLFLCFSYSNIFSLMLFFFFFFCFKFQRFIHNFYFSFFLPFVSGILLNSYWSCINLIFIFCIVASILIYFIFVCFVWKIKIKSIATKPAKSKKQRPISLNSNFFSTIFFVCVLMLLLLLSLILLDFLSFTLWLEIRNAFSVVFNISLNCKPPLCIYKYNISHNICCVYRNLLKSKNERAQSFVHRIWPFYMLYFGNSDFRTQRFLVFHKTFLPSSSFCCCFVLFGFLSICNYCFDMFSLFILNIFLHTNTHTKNKIWWSSIV